MLTINSAIHGSSKDGRFLSLLVLFTLIIHPVAFALEADTSLSVYATFAVYLMLVSYAVIGRKWFVRKIELVLICFAGIGCVVGAMAGVQVYGDSGVGSAVGFLFGLVAILSFAGRLNKADVAMLIYVILLFGIAAALYAFVFQADRWTSVLRGNQVGSNSWRYFSFFGQRNRFAACLYLSTVCGASLFTMTRRKSLAIAVVFLLLQIAITNSRTAFVAALISVLACVILTSKNRLLLCLSLGCAILLGVSLFSDALSSHLSAFFSHYGGFDSASARTDMWEYGLSELSEYGMWLSGFGTGTQDVVLSPLFGVSSFHNMYVELMFEGGVIKIGTYLLLIAGSVLLAKSNSAFAEWRLFRTLYLPLLISWLAFSMLESGATPFSTTFFSFLTSVLLVMLPRCCSTSSASASLSACGLACCASMNKGGTDRMVTARVGQ